MKPKKLSGFEEIEHTADLSLKVWAPSIEELFKNAVNGLNQISKVIIVPGEDAIRKELNFVGIDSEDLLVSLLSEINYLLQTDHLSTEINKILFQPGKLTAEVILKRTTGYEKEIKAVTYHNLKIIQNDNSFSTVIVFDI